MFIKPIKINLGLFIILGVWIFSLPTISFAERNVYCPCSPGKQSACDCDVNATDKDKKLTGKTDITISPWETVLVAAHCTAQKTTSKRFLDIKIHSNEKSLKKLTCTGATSTGHRTLSCFNGGLSKKHLKISGVTCGY